MALTGVCCLPPKGAQGLAERRGTRDQSEQGLVAKQVPGVVGHSRHPLAGCRDNLANFTKGGSTFDSGSWQLREGYFLAGGGGVVV